MASKRVLVWIVVTGLVALTGCSQAPPTRPNLVVATGSYDPTKKQQTYTIAFKPFGDVGKKVEHRKRFQQLRNVRTTDAEGKLLDQQVVSDTSELLYTETVLKAGDPLPLRLKRFYSKAEQKRGDRQETLVFEGRTFIFELKDGRYEAQAEGEPPVPANVLSLLSARVTRPDQVEAMLPGQPVQVDASWPIDVQKMAKLYPNAEFEIPRSSGQAKLLKVSDTAGQLFGTIELDWKLAVRHMFGLKFEPPAMLEMKGTLETAIGGATTAGSFNLTGKLEGTGQGEAKGLKVTTQIRLELLSQEERLAEK